MRLYCCPGPSSLALGHGGVVLGQDLHQFVSPVKRVSEPAQLARDLRGGGDLWGRQITSDRADHTHRSRRKQLRFGAGHSPFCAILTQRDERQLETRRFAPLRVSEAVRCRARLTGSNRFQLLIDELV